MCSALSIILEDLCSKSLVTVLLYEVKNNVYRTAAATDDNVIVPLANARRPTRTHKKEDKKALSACDVVLAKRESNN